MAAYSATIQKQLQLNWPETGDMFSWIDSVDEVSMVIFTLSSFLAVFITELYS